MLLLDSTSVPAGTYLNLHHIIPTSPDLVFPTGLHPSTKSALRSRDRDRPRVVSPQLPPLEGERRSPAFSHRGAFT